MAGPVLRILGQVAAMAVGVFGRAFVTAYQQAVAQAKQGKGAAQAAEAAAKAAGVKKNQMNLGQACQILNITESEINPATVAKQYDRYHSANAVDNGGSFYIQSKVYRAKEMLDMHMREMEERKREEMQAKRG
eukprot:CAMPEP_0182457446 /NCGR_PEP_ID=MMETSP1319-20130603/3008_1 /TAXON_ID=172717 /ORGANISM="Bolidomonas pacifica, Strain RCC208" /LENGTH=132 /DNA_ID=CAMNT_0024655919 /DNA_START=325 /DNA_END=719 /DNA_ORIENTATION=+